MARREVAEIQEDTSGQLSVSIDEWTITDSPLPSEMLIPMGSRRRNPRMRVTSIGIGGSAPCDGKVCYQLFCQAIRDADQVMFDIGLMFEPMTVYACPICSEPRNGKFRSPIYHKGHDRRMDQASVEIYSIASRKRAWDRYQNRDESTADPVPLKRQPEPATQFPLAPKSNHGVILR